MAKLTFWGATKGVTGSKYLIETEQSTILMDCGLLQGSRKDESGNKKPFPFDIGKLDAVVLSHGHLDHSGQLPRLSADGYGGPVYMTNPTSELLQILLRGAAFLRRKRAGKKEIDPLYTIEDVEDVLLQCRGLAYGSRQQVAEGIEICFRDAGHILGSAIVELFITEAGAEKKLVFSGDLGNSQVGLLRDPEKVTDADVLLLESTYGDREHRSMDETLEELEAIIVEATKNGGNILIPSFAVGRTQEIIFRLGELYQKGKLEYQRVYLDSPMAIATTKVYQHFQNVYNEEDVDTIRQGAAGTLKTYLPVLRYSQTTEESMALNKIEGGAIFIAGRAAIHTLGGFSAHASQSQLLRWAQQFANPRPRLYLVHGDAEAKAELSKRFHQQKWPANIAEYGQSISF